MEPRPIEHRILAVDDDPAILELIVTRLSLAGFETFYARDGYECLHRIQEIRPAALVLDVNMPGIDGFGVLKALRDTNCLPPTLMLTARNRTEDVQQAVKLGARDFLTKPFDDKQLIARVRRLIARRPTPGAASQNSRPAGRPAVEI